MPIFQSKQKGFTLIELMIVVAIISILASVAIPAFLKYIKRTKTTEARMLVRKIYDGEVAYFNIDHADRLGAPGSGTFVSAGPQPPTVPVGTSVMGNFTDQGWIDLKFSTDTPSRYSYTAIAAGIGTSSSFTARAEGDLDGDSIPSLFERIASVNTVNGNVEGSPGLYVANELE